MLWKLRKPRGIVLDIYKNDVTQRIDVFRLENVWSLNGGFIDNKTYDRIKSIMNLEGGKVVYDRRVDRGHDCLEWGAGISSTVCVDQKLLYMDFTMCPNLIARFSGRFFKNVSMPEDKKIDKIFNPRVEVGSYTPEGKRIGGKRGREIEQEQEYLIRAIRTQLEYLVLTPDKSYGR